MKRPSVRMSPKQYFSVVACLSIGLLILNIAQQPVLTTKMAAALGIAETIEASDASFFHERVSPILNKYCTDCHDEGKAKGKLRLDNFLYARYSGKTGPNLVPFKVEESHIIGRMTLDQDDKRLMPPLGWARPNADELDVIRLWIAKGASPLLTAEAFPDAPALVKEVHIPLIDEAAVQAARQTISASLENLRRRFPHALSFIARDSALLRFTTVSLQSQLDDEAFLALEDIANSIASLYLRDTALSENSASVLLRMTQVSDAYLSGIAIDEATLLTFIKQQTQLRQLSIPRSLITPDVKRLCAQRNVSLAGVPDSV